MAIPDWNGVDQGDTESITNTLVVRKVFYVKIEQNLETLRSRSTETHHIPSSCNPLHAFTALSAPTTREPRIIPVSEANPAWLTLLASPLTGGFCRILFPCHKLYAISMSWNGIRRLGHACQPVWLLGPRVCREWHRVLSAASGRFLSSPGCLPP